MNINLFSEIGLVLLLGLVTKNSILLVEFAPYSFFYIVQYFGKVLTNENRDNGRRGFIGTQAVIVTGGSDRDATVNDRDPHPRRVARDGELRAEHPDVGDTRVHHEPTRRAPYSVDRVIRAHSEEQSVPE